MFPHSVIITTSRRGPGRVQIGKRLHGSQLSRHTGTFGNGCCTSQRDAHALACLELHSRCSKEPSCEAITTAVTVAKLTRRQCHGSVCRHATGGRKQHGLRAGSDGCYATWGEAGGQTSSEAGGVAAPAAQLTERLQLVGIAEAE